MSADIPAAAQCTKDLDFVILGAKGSYRAQIARLISVEKGAKWKNYDMDILGKLDNL